MASSFTKSKRKTLETIFWDSIFSDIDSLILYAGIHRKVHGYHLLLSKRFPYGIYYEIEQNEIRIRAVLDGRRVPKWIRRKLK